MISSRKPYLISAFKHKTSAIFAAAAVVAGCAASLIQWEHTSDYSYSTRSYGSTMLLDDGRSLIVDRQPAYGSSPQYLSRVRVIDGDGNVISQQDYEGESGKDIYSFDPQQAIPLENGNIFWSNCRGDNFRLEPQTGHVTNAPLFVNEDSYGLCMAARARQVDGSFLLAGQLTSDGWVTQGNAMVRMEPDGHFDMSRSLDFAEVGTVLRVLSIHLEPGGNIGVFVRLVGQDGAYVLIRMDEQFNFLTSEWVDNDRYVAPVMEITDNGEYLVHTSRAFRRFDAQQGEWAEMPVAIAPGAVTMQRLPSGGVLVVSAPNSMTTSASVQVTSVGAASEVNWQQSYPVPESKAGLLSSPITSVAPDGKVAISYRHDRYVNNGIYVADGPAGSKIYPVSTGYHKTFVHFINADGKQINSAALPVATASIVRDFEGFIDEMASCKSGVYVNQVKYLNDKMINMAGFRSCVDGYIRGEFDTHVSETVLRLTLP